MAAVMGSNCEGTTKRWQKLRLLENMMDLDTYGRCGKIPCDGNFRMDCNKINQYKFYFAWENSACQEYITEKVWWNAYHKGAVPVVLGIKVLRKSFQ